MIVTATARGRLGDADSSMEATYTLPARLAGLENGAFAFLPTSAWETGWSALG